MLLGEVYDTNSIACLSVLYGSRSVLYPMTSYTTLLIVDIHIFKTKINNFEGVHKTCSLKQNRSKNVHVQKYNTRLLTGYETVTLYIACILRTVFD